MGVFISTNQALSANPTGQNRVNSALLNGKIRVIRDQCFWSGTDVGPGSTMLMCTLPRGAVPLLTIIQPIASNGVPTPTTNAVTGTVGLMAGATESAAPAILGTFTSLAAANAPAQLLSPAPDGTVYNGITPLREPRQVFITQTSGNGVAGQGVSLTIIYGMPD